MLARARLRVLASLALVVAAAFAGRGWVLQRMALQSEDAALMNLAGRQRMLSQRTLVIAQRLPGAPRVQRPMLEAKLERLASTALESQNRIDRALGLESSQATRDYRDYLAELRGAAFASDMADLRKNAGGTQKLMSNSKYDHLIPTGGT